MIAVSAAAIAVTAAGAALSFIPRVSLKDMHACHDSNPSL